MAKVNRLTFDNMYNAFFKTNVIIKILQILFLMYLIGYFRKIVLNMVGNTLKKIYIFIKNIV